MKKRVCAILLFVGVVCCACFIAFQLSDSKIVSAEECSQQTFLNCDDKSFFECNTNGYLALQTANTRFLQNEIISLDYISYYESQIVNITYLENGFNVDSLVLQNENKAFKINVSYELGRVDYSLLLQIELNNGDYVSAKLFGFLNDYGMFISQFSPDSAREAFYKFAKINNIMTEEECQQARVKFWENSVTSNGLSSEIENVQPVRPSLDIQSTSSETIEVKGDLIWKDDRNVAHPLRYVKVEIYKTGILNGNLIGTTYANDSGSFSLLINKSNFSSSINNHTIYVVVYASDGNVNVQIEDTGEVYSYYQTRRVYLNTGTTNGDCDFEFAMQTNLGQAMQISQALFTARNYAEVLMGERPTAVNAWYPYGNNGVYTAAGIKIPLNSGNGLNSYASWDVIMHEYGHHVQTIVNNENNIGGNHSNKINYIDHFKDKDWGIRLAWGESWPTIFGMMAQQYYSTQLSGVLTTGNAIYESCSGDPDDIENTYYYLGDGCELSIMAVLWDLYDNVNETGDMICLGHQDFWDVTAVDGVYTFSDFINYFYEIYPEYVYSLGPNLTKYKMASTAPVLTNEANVSQTVSPTFSWTAQGGSEQFPNNSFKIVVFDTELNETIRTGETTSTTYQLTQSEWNSVLYSYGCAYYVAVVAYQTGSPLTGGYISAFLRYEKPTPPTLTESFTMLKTNRYIEKIANLQPNQEINYNVTLQSGSKLIQTFGNCDAVIEIYDTSGFLVFNVEDLDDAGSGNNSLANLYVANDNTQYRINVSFYDDEAFGEIKLTIVPAFLFYEEDSSAIIEYEDILEIHSYHYFTLYAYCSDGHMSVLRFSPPASGNYSITLSSEFDNYLYVIDPRSTATLIEDVNYNDDLDDDNRNAYLTGYFEEGVEYFIVFGQYNPNASFSDYDTGDDITVIFSYIG